MEPLNSESISLLQSHLSRLTGLPLSIHKQDGTVLLAPVRENKFLGAVQSSPGGSEYYRDFFRKHIGLVVQRNDVSMIRGPAGEYHCFIPVSFDNTVYVIASGGVYLSHGDFENFYRKHGHAFGLNPGDLKSWYPVVIRKDAADLRETIRFIRSLFSLVLQGNFQKSLTEKRYRLMKVFISLISDLRLENQSDEVYDLVIDVMLFLFPVESISLLVKEHDCFCPKRSGGRFRDYLQSLRLPVAGVISEVIEKQSPVLCESAMELLRMGIREEITSLHLFPILSDRTVAGLLCICNSSIGREHADLVSEICSIVGFVFRIRDLQGTFSRYMQEIDILNTAAERITPVKEPDVLYEAILDTSVRLAAAEKGSLMLIDGDESCLTVKAARGINRRLLGEIRIREGEGIAGKVFREGMPLIVEDIESDEHISAKKRPKYKTGSFISIPLRIGDQTIGILNISDKITGEVFSKDDLNLLRSFASYATIALERSNYYSLVGRLRELSITDALTGLFNRRYFEDRFFEELQRSRRHGLAFSLAMIDIDDFKLFNDTEGHLAGDEILKSVAYGAKECLRVIDVFARFGGEEFVALMPQTTKEEAFMVAERIRLWFREGIPHTWDTYPREHLTVSIGIATFPHDGEDRKALLRNADKALYRAKMEGKDRVVPWSD
ncbi:MAG: diguanylate cyclase [Nitrospirota bacterium]